MLEQRAIALKSAKFQKADKIEKEMTEYKNVNFERVTYPNSAYCTFKKDSAFLKILELYDANGKENEDVPEEEKHIQFLGENLKVNRAMNPTNIQWENFSVSKKQRKWRYFCVILSLIIGGALYFLFATYALQISQRAGYLLNHPTMNCDHIIESFDRKTLQALTVMEAKDQ